MEIKEVKDKKDRRAFIELPIQLYRNEPNWIRPLDKDIEGVFDPKKNKYFRKGEACRWLLLDDSGETIGRVAAFVDYKTANSYDYPTGGMGFFECINNKDAAFMLFDRCKEWLQERNMEAMDGPINFGDRDRWWGLLVDGFDLEPNYCMPYNFPYYQDLFEAYGFQIYFKQYTYRRRVVEDGLPEKVRQRAARILENKKYKFKHIEKKNLTKYAEDFRIVYNKAWVKYTGVRKMSEMQAKAIMNRMKPIIDEKILWFAYYEEEPVAFFLNLPEVNQIFKHVNGKLNWIGKLKFLYHKKMQTCRKMFGVAFGIVPEHQGKGLEAALVLATTDFFWSNKSPYEDFEMNWIGDFNPKMMRVAEGVGGQICKTHHTYRKLFDENAEFKRAPSLD